jgi:hypothetical protein
MFQLSQSVADNVRIAFFDQITDETRPEKHRHIFSYDRDFSGFGKGCKLLNINDRERGFEPPTPWSRTRFQALLKFTGICDSSVIDMKLLRAVRGKLLQFIEIGGFLCHKFTYSRLPHLKLKA